MDSIFETQKRLKLANELASRWKQTKGVVLAGSVAYAPNTQVTKESDLDLLIVQDDIKQILPALDISDQDKKALEVRTFEGYSLKSVIDDIPISIHILNQDCFEIITKCYVADIRLYRASAKKQTYDLFGYSGQRYSYHVKNIPLQDLSGARIFVPVYFISEDRHYLGIHRDKLLSNPIVLHDPNTVIHNGIDTLWKKVVQDVKSEQLRVDSDASLLNALSRRNKLNSEVLEEIASKEQFYLSRI